MAKAEAAEAVPRLAPSEGLPPPPHEDLRRVGEVLAATRKPVAVIGLSLTRTNIRKVLQSFIEERNVPFVTTLMAKGYLPDDHPLNAGVIGRARRTDVRRFTDQADVILGIGYDVIEINYEEWIRDGVPRRFRGRPEGRCRRIGSTSGRSGGRPVSVGPLHTRFALWPH